MGIFCPFNVDLQDRFPRCDGDLVGALTVAALKSFFAQYANNMMLHHCQYAYNMMEIQE